MAHHPSATPPPTAGQPVLREALVRLVASTLHPGQGALLTGPEGIGRTTLLDALATVAAGQGARVLRCGPTAAELGTAYAGLVDLLRPLPDSLLAALPPPQRQALTAALLRGAPTPGSTAGDFAVATALTALLGDLAADRPLLLVLDDAQHLDRASAGALAHVARRAPTLAVTFLVAVRTGGATPSAPPGRVLPRQIRRFAVPSLADDELVDLLRQHRRWPLPQAALRSVLRLADGNPATALELAEAAALAPQPEPTALDEPEIALPPRLLDRELASVRALPEDTAQALLLLALGSTDQPALTVLGASGVDDPVLALAAAERARLVALGPDGVARLRSPLLAAALRQGAGLTERVGAHAALARAVGDPVDRARHLALARPCADEQVAAALDAAAATARRRGDAATAHELARLAAARTPPDRPEHRDRRRLDAAAHAVAAARHDWARTAAQSVLTCSDDPRQRVRARLLLLDTAGQALEETGPLIAAGLAEAEGRPALLAALYRWSAVRELLGGRTGPAARAAARAAGLADRAGEPALGAQALGVLATVLALRGRPRQADPALRRALRLEHEAVGGAASTVGAEAGASLLRRRALAALDADRVGQASRLLSSLAQAAGAGVEEQVATLVALTRVQVRAGDCRRAEEHAARCVRLLGATGLDSPLGAYATALAACAGGTPEGAVAAARAAVRGSAADGDRLFEVRALGVLGESLLHAGGAERTAHAVEALQRARTLAARMELADPDAVRRLADLAEATALLGEHDEAEAVLTEAGATVAGWREPAWGAGAAAAVGRSRAVALAARGDSAGAVTLLRATVESLRALPLPLELARALIAWGAVERRARHRAAARDALTEAERLCLRHGAFPLLTRARTELDRLTPGERAPGRGAVELTAGEQRLARLVADGATNREAAAALFVSVKTVEGTLSRVYRKLGVRSRTALARALQQTAGSDR